MKFKNAHLANVRLTAPFAAGRIRTNHDVTIPSNLKKCEETGRFRAFKLAWKPGMPDKPHIYWDSDVAKVIEGMSYDEILFPDPERRKKLDQYVEQIIASAGDDGYLNSYFNGVEPEKRWQCLGTNHELYCAGHLIEAAVAYFQATGKRNFLDTMCRYADYIGSVFGNGPEKRRGVPGHEEIELALCKLAEATESPKYRKLAEYFINDRGVEPNTFDEEQMRLTSTPFTPYMKEQIQAHLPVREQTEAVGHAVRALYLYSGMADLADQTGDDSLLEACKILWKDLTEKKMYITGGIGSTPNGERFGNPWHLPNDFTYVESCAAIAVCLFARRMLNITGDGKYADILERTLCNAALAGISLDGFHFFYANRFQLDASVEPRLNGTGFASEREEWFFCSCCPTNYCRFLPQIGTLSFSEAPDGMRIDIPFAAEVSAGGMKISVKGGYPYDGNISVEVLNTPGKRTLSLRIPSWCRSWALAVNGKEIHPALNCGYAEICREWSVGDMVQLSLGMPVRRIYANPHVTACSGQTALMRGPVVYVLESADQPGVEFERILLPAESEFEVISPEDLPAGTAALRFQGREEAAFPDDLLYSESAPERKTDPVTLTAIPYALWGNRGTGSMRLWLRTC